MSGLQRRLRRDNQKATNKKAPQAPALNSVMPPQAVPGFDGVTADIIYRGPSYHAGVLRKQQVMRLDEIKRLAVLRRGLPRDVAPELYPSKDGEDPKYQSGEYQEALLEFARGVVRDLVVGVSGPSVGGVSLSGIAAGDDLASAIESSGVLLPLMQLAIEKQDPTEAQVF